MCYRSIGSFDYYARVTRTSKTSSFQFFFFFIYFSLFFPNPFVSPPLPLLSHSRKSIQRNFYVIKKYFGLSILILITSWQTFKWATKIISFVYLPCLGIIERSFPFLLFILDRYRFPRDYDVRIRTICEISTIRSFLSYKIYYYFDNLSFKME